MMADKRDICRDSDKGIVANRFRYLEYARLRCYMTTAKLVHTEA